MTSASPSPSASETTPARPRARRPLGAVLLVVAVASLAVNLRPGATSVGPVMEDIVGAFGQGAVAAGLLTALPPLAFGALGLLAVPISRRLGLTGAILASFAIVAAGLLLRPLTGSFSLFVLLSVLALLGPALGNVLLPAWIKVHGGTRTVALMTLYTVVLAIGGSSGAALAVPLEGPGADGWRVSLQFWGFIVAVPVLLWVLVLRRTGHDFPPSPPRGSLNGSLLRSPTAIALTVMFALQSLNAYTQFGMLPQILTANGVSPTHAGLLVAVISGSGLVGGLVMPTVIARIRRGLPGIVGSFGVLTTIGYVGLLLLPGVDPLVWAIILGIGGFAFPTVIALLPARTRSPLVTARLSGAVQPVGYLLAALGPIAAGALLGATGASASVLWFLAGTGVLLAVFGFQVGRPRLVDDEIGA